VNTCAIPLLFVILCHSCHTSVLIVRQMATIGANLQRKRVAAKWQPNGSQVAPKWQRCGRSVVFRHPPVARWARRRDG
jgi:hypothetical protein